MNLSGLDLNMDESNSFFKQTRKWNLFGIPLDRLIHAVGVNTDTIICHFLIAFAYLFVALEEADYQVLSALDQDSGNFKTDISDRDEWSLKSLAIKRLYKTFNN